MRRRLALILSLLAPCTKVMAADIIVSLHNPPSEGQIAMALYDANGANDYDTIVQSQQFPIREANKYFLRNIPAGSYALRLYVDENSNNELDSNFMGIPTEPVGYSNGYKPSGVPSFEPAVFQLEESDVLSMDVSAESPLSSIGQFNVGVGLQTQLSPYRSTDITTLPVPLITYIGERVQVLGPEVFYQLTTWRNIDFATTLSYRFPAYSENDGSFFEGMKDRDGAVMLGVIADAKLSDTLSLLARYKHDAFNTIGGGVTHVQLRRSGLYSNTQWHAGVGLNWLSTKISRHEFGVPDSAISANRPAYTPDNIGSVQTELGAFISLKSKWRVQLSLLADFYNSEAKASPLVDKDYAINFFSAISYAF